jgi:glycosyltransferase involved in cell wall biosynthesis
MSFGLPAIVSNIRSNSSVVRDGIDGAVIEIENWRSSESEIVRLFADNQYYQSVSNNVRIRISDEFNARKQFEKIEELFLR